MPTATLTLTQRQQQQAAGQVRASRPGQRERERAHTGKGITGATTWRRGRPSQQAHNDDTGHNKLLLKPTAFRCRWHPPRYPPTWAALPPCICIPRPPENACVCSRCVALRVRAARPPGRPCLALAYPDLSVFVFTVQARRV